MRIHAGVRTWVTVAALLAGTAACGEDASTAPPSPTPQTDAPEPSGTDGTAGPSESATPSEPVTAAVWFVVDTRAGLRLVRELRELPGADPAREAVEAMVEGAVDPDYTTTWNPATEVLSVTQEGDAVTVDLSEDAATASVGSEGAALMVQQLVYTVTGALGAEGAGVRLLVEGEPAGELWGAVSWEGVERRADPLSVRSLVQVDVPAEDATMSSPVRVEGEAATFEAVVPWRVLDAAGDVVETGTAMAEEGMTLSPFSFEVELPPGSYVVEVSEDDPSGGEGGEPMTDTRSFVVE